jgi:hypothetical protein
MLSLYTFLEYQMMDKVQKPSNSEYYTPPSEPFRTKCEGRVFSSAHNKETYREPGG